MMKTIDRAAAAERLKENDDFRDVIACIEEDLFQTFRNIPLGDDEALAKAHQFSHGFKLFLNRIDKYVEIARHEANIPQNEIY